MIRKTLFVMALSCAAGCGASPDGGDESEPGETTLDATGIRSPIEGLLDRAFVAPIDADMPFVDNNVVQVNWDELETAGTGTTPGGFFAAKTNGWKKLDSALAVGPMKIRILGGVHAPAYVKRIGFGGNYDGGGTTGQCSAGGVYVYNPHDDTGGCVPKFWTSAVLARYEALMKEVAARLAGNANFHEIVDSACMTNYAEPFYRAHVDKPSNQRLIDAGLTWQKDVYCHQHAISIHQAVFPSIRTALAVNSWDEMDPTKANLVLTRFQETFDFVEGGPSIPMVLDANGKPTSTAWTGARKVLGLRLVLQNNGLGENDSCKLAGGDSLDNAKKETFCYLSYTARTTSSSVGFQTETMDRLREKQPDGTYLHTAHQGVEMALNNALAMHANFVELPGGYKSLDAASDLSMLKSKDVALEANTP